MDRDQIFLRRVPKHFDEQLCLGREMPIQRAGRDAGAFGNGLDRRRRVAAFVEQLARRSHQAFARLSNGRRELRPGSPAPARPGGGPPALALSRRALAGSSLPLARRRSALERAMEVADRRLEATELEELVRAAREPVLDRERDRAVLDPAGVEFRRRASAPSSPAGRCGRSACT